MQLQHLLQDYQLKSQATGNIAHEFQDFAYRLAMSLSHAEDRETIGLCMRLAKKKPRALLEQARDFVQDAHADNKVALFLWKLKELEKLKRLQEAAKDKKAKSATAQASSTQGNLFE